MLPVNQYSTCLNIFAESDLIPGIATFIACLILPLEIGIITGIGLNLISILYHAARPKISIEIHKVCHLKHIYLIKFSIADNLSLLYIWVILTKLHISVMKY